jgi:serine protease Do
MDEQENLTGQSRGAAPDGGTLPVSPAAETAPAESTPANDTPPSAVPAVSAESGAGQPQPVSEEWPPPADRPREEPAHPSVDEQLAAAGLPLPSARRTGESAGLPGEVVEYYEPGFGREVVETYVQPRPLPGRRPEEKLPRRRRRRGLWIFLLCAAAVAALAAGAFLLNRDAPPPAGSEGAAQSAAEEEKETVSIPRVKAGADVRLTVDEQTGPALTAQEVYAKVNSSVVTVLVQLKSGASVGTGVIFTADGYILTNYHVVAGGLDCSITLYNDTTLTAKYVAGDMDNDLAVLKVEAKGLQPAAIGSSDALSVGDTVYAIGNPLGVELRGTFTDGIVSAINRDVEVDGRTMTLIQTNAALNSGNSGGPLVNSAGQVVGINTIKMSSAFSSIEGLGFAIPSSSMQYIVNDLLAYGAVKPEPRLGIGVAHVGTTLPDGTVGVKVLDVEEDSAAEKAGMQTGDVIVAADGESVDSSAALLRIRRRFDVGDQMTVRVWRQGEYLTLTLDL